MIGIDGKQKPVFSNGDRVAVDWKSFKNEDNYPKNNVGTISGLASSGLEDSWIVSFEKPLSGKYPYSCYVVPHMYLKYV